MGLVWRGGVLVGVRGLEGRGTPPLPPSSRRGNRGWFFEVNYFS